MAYLLRLTLALLLLVGSASVSALVPKLGTQYQPFANLGFGSGLYSSPASLCEAYRAKRQSTIQANNPTITVTITVSSINSAVNPGTCVLAIKYQSGSIVEWAEERGNFGWVTNQCPANSTASGAQCACNAGFVEDSSHTSCVVAPTAPEKWKNWCTAAAGKDLGFVEMPGRNLSSGCQNLTLAGSPIDTPGYVPGEVPLDAGCTITFGNKKSFPDADGSWYTQADAHVSGGTCREGAPQAGDPAGTEAAPAAKPPTCVNGYAGSVNGTTVCAKPDTTKGVDWAGTKTQVNADGTTKITDTETKCKAGVCDTTTKETTKAANGTVTGTSTNTVKESAGSLCARDKGNGACTVTGAGGAGGGEGDGNGFSGTCAAGFKAVSEDAVLNAMAEEQYKRNCQFFEKTPEASEESGAYGEMKAKGKSGVDQTAQMGAGFNRAVNIGPGDFDGSSAINASSCIRDLPITMSGLTITLPLSRVCPYLDYIGTLLTVVAYLLAARILVRG